MIEPSRILRLDMAQWQGGDRPDYRIGGRVLAAIAPDPVGPHEFIAIPAATSDERPVDRGIVSRDAVLRQAAAARAAIERHAPDAIVTLGGDCGVDLAPIAYLSERYRDDLAVLWIDAHPDVVGPDQYPGAHAHVQATLLGEGDGGFTALVPRPVAAIRVLYVGLAETGSFETGFIRDHGLARLAPEQIRTAPGSVLDWLRGTAATRVAVHFDVDVLDPASHDFVLFRDPAAPADLDGVPRGRLHLDEVVDLLRAVAEQVEIVGLAITEYMPWSAIELSRSLRRLPLLGT